MRSDNGLNSSWETWVSRAIGGLEAGQDHLHQRIEDNRQAAFQDLWHVRRELLGRIAPLERRRGKRTEWLRHVPWLKLAILAMVATLVLTGHLTAAELKVWLLRKIEAF
jgi:hypothetical protein